MAGKSLHVGVDATTWANDRGFGRFTRELLTALAARSSGIRYTLIFDQVPEEPLPPGLSAISVSTRHSLRESSTGTHSRSPAYLWRMGQAVSRERFDVFFFPAVYSYFPILARVPCVICYHDTTAERFPELLFPTKLNHRLWQAKTFLAKLQTARAMTVSSSSAEDLEQILRIPKERIDVVTEAADPHFRVMEDPGLATRVRERHAIPAETQLLVFVGGMNRHKNILGLLKAMPRVVAARPETHLAIVGSLSGNGFWDNVPELKAFVRDHPPIAQHVHFTDRLEDAELVELLNIATAMVFPSLWEGFGLPAVEAMACGIPVLASNRSSLPEVVGDAGAYFDPEDPDDIARCLIEFVGNPEQRQDLADRASARARQFTWERASELAEASLRRCYEEHAG